LPVGQAKTKAILEILLTFHLVDNAALTSMPAKNRRKEEPVLLKSSECPRDDLLACSNVFALRICWRCAISVHEQVSISHFDTSCVFPADRPGVGFFY